MSERRIVRFQKKAERHPGPPPEIRPRPLPPTRPRQPVSKERFALSPENLGRLQEIARLIEDILKDIPPPTPCDCASCPPDPAWTCSYTGEDEIIEDAYIANAYRGNLLLTPGDARGVIGGLLHSLDPPQHYTHMGVMAADFNLIRHCTMNQDRLIAKEYYTGSMAGIAAPLDGLDVDHARFGWPGTITQSTYQAIFADRYGKDGIPPGHNAPYAGSMLPDLESKQSPPSTYLMNQLGFDTVSDDGVTWFPPLVVKPCSRLTTTLHLNVLDAIAQEALRTYAHYRFYGYSQGDIGGVADFSGPLMTVPDAQPDFNFATGRWADWADGIKWVTRPTIPAVCSSFAWQLVQNVSSRNRPKIVLDWAHDPAAALGEAGGTCVRALAPDWTGDTAGADGLYRYDEGDRITAANTLHDNLSQFVYDALKKNLKDSGGVQAQVAKALDDIGRGTFAAAAVLGVDALSKLFLTALGADIVDAVLLGELIELLYDMPDDIANQVCNIFAFDCARGFPADGRCVDAKGNEIRDVDSQNWNSAPGNGMAVSPDNIHMFWDAPGLANIQLIEGLYGYNKPAQVCVGVFSRPKCFLVASDGTAIITGLVFHNGQALAGAYVSAACSLTTTPDPGHDPRRPNLYQLPVRSGGMYKVIARYEDPDTGLTLYGEAVTNIIPRDSVIRADVTVIEPPACMRNIVIQGTIACDDVSLWSSNSDQQAFRKTLFVQFGVPVFNVKTGKWDIDTSHGAQRLTDQTGAGFSSGDSDASFNISAHINPGFDVDVTVEGILNQNDENISTGAFTFNVAPGETVPLSEGSCDTGGAFPDRAYFRDITVTNNAVTAI